MSIDGLKRVKFKNCFKFLSHLVITYISIQWQFQTSTIIPFWIIITQKRFCRNSYRKFYRFYFSFSYVTFQLRKVLKNSLLKVPTVSNSLLDTILNFKDLSISSDRNCVLRHKNKKKYIIVKSINSLLCSESLIFLTVHMEYKIIENSQLRILSSYRHSFFSTKGQCVYK